MVVNSDPMQRVLAHPWHLGRRPIVVNVVRVSVTQNADSLYELIPSSELLSLDLLFLSSDIFPAVMRSLLSWPVSRTASALAVLPSALAALEGAPGLRRPLAVRDAADETRLVAVGAGSYSSLLGSFANAGAAVCTRRSFEDSDIPGDWDLEQLHRCVDLDVIRCTVDDFETSHYSLNTSAVAWMLTYLSPGPASELHITPMLGRVSSYARVDLLLQLHQQGFSAVSNPPAWCSGGDLEYDQAAILSGSKWYFVSLLSRDLIVAKGAGAILHKCHAVYYRGVHGTVFNLTNCKHYFWTGADFAIKWLAFGQV